MPLPLPTVIGTPSGKDCDKQLAVPEGSQLGWCDNAGVRESKVIYESGVEEVQHMKQDGTTLFRIS